jgi:hypothetical protein
MWAIPYIAQLEFAVNEWHNVVRIVRAEVAARDTWTRKDFAIEMQKKYAEDRMLFSMAMTFFTGGEITSELLRKFMERYKDPTEERVE